jgi:hypothetical protein
MTMDFLTSRRLWGGLLAIAGALTGGAVLTEAQIATQVDQIIAVIGIVSSLAGGVLSIVSKLFPKQS